MTREEKLRRDTLQHSNSFHDCGLSRYPHSASLLSLRSLRSLRSLTPSLAPLTHSLRPLRSLTRSAPSFAPFASLVRFLLSLAHSLALLSRSLRSLVARSFAPLGSTIVELRWLVLKFRAKRPMIVASHAPEPCRSFVFGPKPYAQHPFEIESAPS